MNGSSNDIAADRPAPPPAPESRPKKKRRLLRLFLILCALPPLFVILVIGISETRFFRNWLRDFAVRQVNENLNATLRIGNIRGNIFTGLTLEDIRFDARSGPFASCSSVVVRYDLFQLPYKYIRLDEVSFNALRLTLTRDLAGRWNYEGLSKDTTASKGSSLEEWTFVLQNLRLNDCAVSVFDSTIVPLHNRNRVAFGRLDLDRIDLAMRATIAKKETRVAVDQFRFENRLGEFALENFSGDFLLSPARAGVRNLSIETKRSALLLTASLDSLDLLKPFTFEQLAGKHLSLSLDASRLNVKDLQSFLPALDFLGGTMGIHVNASGSLRNLDLPAIVVRTPKSSIALEGLIMDIDRGKDLVIQVYSNGMVIDPAELPAILPGIPLPNYADVGPVRFSKLLYDGRPLKFHAELNMASDAGDAKGAVDFDLTLPEMAYKADVRTAGVNLALILGKPELRSFLNVDAKVQGSGLHPGAMTAKADIRADSSRWAGNHISSFVCAARAERDTLMLEFSGQMEQMNAAATIGLGYAEGAVRGYNVAARSWHLDLSRILGERYASDLTFSLEGEGNSLDLDRMSGSFLLTLQKSRFRDLLFEPDTATVLFDQHDPLKKEYLLKTRYADAEMRGLFRPTAMLEFYKALTDSLPAAADYFALRRRETAAAPPPAIPSAKPRRAAKEKPQGIDSSRFVDASYSIKLKQTQLLANFFPQAVVDLQGTYDGTISGGMAGLNLDGALRLSDAYIVDSARKYLAGGVTLRYRVRNLAPAGLVEKLRADADFAFRDLQINETRLRRGTVSLQFADKGLRLNVDGGYDTTLTLRAALQARIEDHSYRIELPALAMDMQGSKWSARGPVLLRVDSGRVAIEECTIAREEEKVGVSITGARTFAGSNDFRLYAEALRLRDIEFLLTGNRSAMLGQSFNGNTSIEATVTGTDRDPELACFVSIDSLSYKNYPIGRFSFEATYANQLVRLLSELFAEQQQPPRQLLIASGKIPVDISFATGADRLEEQPAEFALRMTDFPLAVVEKFIGIFSNLEGVANADIRLVGTADKPEYSGALTIRDATGIFRQNNMRYHFSADIEPRGNSIVIREVTLRNDPQEYADGKMTATGKINLEKFGIRDFFVTTSGNLKVLRAASRSATKVIYGDLFVATGREGLTFSGRLDRSKLTGRVELTRGNLVFPSERTGGSAGRAENVIYLVVDDTTKEKVSSLSGGGVTKRRTLFGKPIEEESAGGGASRSILDGLTYDLTLSTQGTVRIAIPFNSLTQEELNAQLQVEELKVNNWGGRGKFEGEVKLAGDSYYLFFGKKFQASGELYFSGDPLNPDLDLRTVYSDYHTDASTRETRRIYVILSISGTKSKPIVSFDIRQDTPDGARPDLRDVQSDALSFIMTGSFTDELTSAEKGKLLDKAQGLSNTLASSLLSSAMSGFLQKAGLSEFVNRVELSNLGTSDPRLRVSTEIGRAVITYDGRITDLGSSDVKVEIPVRIGLSNFVLEVSRKTLNTSLEGAITPQETSIYEARIVYRITF